MARTRNSRYLGATSGVVTLSSGWWTCVRISSEVNGLARNAFPRSRCRWRIEVSWVYSEMKSTRISGQVAHARRASSAPPTQGITISVTSNSNGATVRNSSSAAAADPAAFDSRCLPTVTAERYGSSRVDTLGNPCERETLPNSGKSLGGRTMPSHRRCHQRIAARHFDGPQSLLSPALLECPRRDSNSHGVAPGGF